MKKSLKAKITPLLLVFALLSSCKSHYNDTIDWMDNITPGTSLEDVKASQPDFVEVDWNKPDTINDVLRFRIDKVRGNNDVLAMEHYLLFSGDKFQGRASAK